MDIETLQYFQYIATYKNVTKAAKHFYISQSTLSRQMMALEKELDVTLFIRDNKKIELTEAGKVLHRDCELFIKHMEIIINNTQSADKGISGVLRIASPGNLCDTLTQSLITFKRTFPSTNLIIESYDFNEIPSAVLYNIYNIGFTYAFASSSNEDVDCVTVGEDDFSLVVSSQIIQSATSEEIAKVVKTLPLILPSYTEPPFLKLMLHELKSFAETKYIETIYVNTTDSVMLQISLGLGYSIVPTSLTKSKSGMDHITYIPLNHFSAKGNIVMLYKKSNNSEIVNRFVNIVNTICSTNTL